MKCSAWIRTCVDVFDHPVLDNGPYDRRSAWLWMIANASRLDRRVNHKGKAIELKRGQLLAGRAFLAAKWQWTEKQVRIFMDLLASENMIEKGQSNGHYANVVTICNYDAYQSPKEKARPVAGPEQGQSRASEGPDSNTDTQVVVSISNRAGEDEKIPDGFSPLGHGALINCETIRHPEFTISITAVKMQLALVAPDVDARQACSIAALQWAAEIEGGKSASKVVPGNVLGAIVGGVRMGKFREAEHETRTTKARSGYDRVDYAQAKIDRNKAFMDRLKAKASEASA